MNGRKRLIAAPRTSPQNEGGVYRISGGELEEDGGDEDNSSFPEYCSESEGMVKDDSVIALCPFSDDMLKK